MQRWSFECVLEISLPPCIYQAQQEQIKAVDEI
jgi:hypothetical protein